MKNVSKKGLQLVALLSLVTIPQMVLSQAGAPSTAPSTTLTLDPTKGLALQKALTDLFPIFNGIHDDFIRVFNEANTTLNTRINDLDTKTMQKFTEVNTAIDTKLSALDLKLTTALNEKEAALKAQILELTNKIATALQDASNKIKPSTP